MTTETKILTVEQIVGILHNTPLAPKDGHHVVYARAVEQAVLQSEQVQAWKRDAERYHSVLSMTLHQYSDLYQANIKTGAPFDWLVDAAMEKQP